MHHHKTRVAAILAALTMSMSVLSAFSVRADDNVAFGAVTVTTVKHDNGSPLSVTNVVSPGDLNLDAIVQGAGLDALGDPNTPPDPVLGMVPVLHYQLRDGNGGIIGSTSTSVNQYLYSPSGFSQIYIDHSNVGRYYLRVFTKGKGWLPWQTSKESSPNGDSNDKVQALQLRIKGYAADLNDIYYKVVLNDGTVLDWARNGETTGTIGTDKYIVAIRIGLWHRTNPFTQPTAYLMQAPNYEGPYMDSSGNVQYSRADSQPYTGWAFYDNKQYYFSEGSRAVGWQYINGMKFYFDESGKLVTDLEPIMGLTGDYRLKYNKATRTMTVLAKDGANGYIIPFKTFTTTNGPETPLGTYNIYAKYRWKFMHDTIYCQFLSRFKGGYLMHSLIYYDKPNSDHLHAETYNFMDDAVSGGCIRMRAGDTAWIFTHCANGTPITIYEDKWDKGPIEKPAIDKVIPANQTYDPTDPVKAEQHARDQAARDAADQGRVDAIKAAQAADALLRASQRGVPAQNTSADSETAAQGESAAQTETPAPADSTGEAPTAASSEAQGETTAPETSSQGETTAPAETSAPSSASEALSSEAPSSAAPTETNAPSGDSAQTSAPQ